MHERRRVLGILPDIGGSIGLLERAGQLRRLLDYYFPAYLERFDSLRYFSYERERIEDFTDDPQLLRRVVIVAPNGRAQRHARALWIGVGRDQRLLRECTLARALQAPGALPAALAHTPFVCTYGFDYAGFTQLNLRGRAAGPALAVKRAVMRASLRFVLHRAKAAIATSEDGTRAARLLGARNVALIPNGVDLELFSPTTERPAYDVTYVGQLVPRKDVATLIDAVRLAGRSIRLCIVGSGPELDELRARSEAQGVQATFLGTLENRRIAEVLQRSRVFVLPSRAEGHPKALIEALGCGLACVTADIAAVADLKAAGVILTFEPGAAATLTERICALLDHARLAEGLGLKARAFAERELNLRQLVVREADFLGATAGQLRT